MRSAAPSFLPRVPLAVALLSLATCTHLPPAPPEPECSGATALVPGVPGSPGHLLPSLRNPNGDSELAALMRRFVDDLGAARAAVKARAPKAALAKAHRRMRCAWPTDVKDRTPTFDALAIVYLAQVEALDAAGPAADLEYARVLEGCQGCHQASCPGPLDVIEGLRP